VWTSYFLSSALDRYFEGEIMAGLRVASRVPLAIVLGSVIGVVATAGKVHAGSYTVSPLADYYDGFGNAPTVVALNGATALQFQVTGGVSTDGSGRLASPDGLYSDGSTPYNSSNVGSGGTHNGVSIGATTGVDPALFGVFFSPSFVGTAPNSDNYRSDASPDIRGLLSYSPLLNQPFFIGDGYTGLEAYGAPSTGSLQTFHVPAGAQFLLLGIGADTFIPDNGGPGLTVNVLSIPEPSSLMLGGTAAWIGLAGLAARNRRRRDAV
jgi:hypothetical protein